MRGLRARRELYRWRYFARSSEPPPPLYKQLTVRDYARRYRTSVLVETGTHAGNMVDAQSRTFERIYSIELDPQLALRARRRFAERKHITILEGDSGDLLPKLLPEIPEKCLFWLDGHYSGEGTARGAQLTPIEQELSAIIGGRRLGDVVLIDDARLFTGPAGYPALEDLLAWIQNKPGWTTEALDDIIRVTPKTALIPD